MSEEEKTTLEALVEEVKSDAAAADASEEETAAADVPEFAAENAEPETPVKPEEDPEIAELEARLEAAAGEESAEEAALRAEKEAKKKAREERKAAKKAKKAQKAVKAADTEAPEETVKEAESMPAEKKEKKAAKPKKARKPVWFDTAKTSGGLAGRCAVILIHSLAIAYALMWLFGALEMLISSNPASFSAVYPFTTAAMHGMIGAIAAVVYGIARIICVIVKFVRKK